MFQAYIIVVTLSMYDFSGRTYIRHTRNFDRLAVNLRRKQGGTVLKSRKGEEI
jgi:hypothetical protein